MATPQSPPIAGARLHGHGSMHGGATPASHPGLSSSAASSSQQALHPSAHTMTALPSFSHAALGAYQLRIDPAMAAELMALRQGTGMSLHRKTEVCLQALEALAERCIINHGDLTAAQQQRAEEEAAEARDEGAAFRANAIIRMLSDKSDGTTSGGAGTGAGAGGDRGPEAQLDGVPLSQHQSALRSTILNLRNMVLPLLAAPRHVFQEALNRAEECAVQYGAIRYETEERDSNGLGERGRRASPRAAQSANYHAAEAAAVAAAASDATAAAAASSESESGLGGLHSDSDTRRRGEQRREQEAKLAALDAQLRMHADLLDEEKRVEPDRNLDLLGPTTPPADDADSSQARDRLSGVHATGAGTAASSAAPSGFQHKFLLTRDPECLSLDSNAAPYYEVVQNLQYMKTALQARLASRERAYLEGVSRLYGAGEEVSYLRELNRTKDMRTVATAKSEAKMGEEFVELRQKLNENYAEVKKARAKNADMKRDIGRLGGGGASANGGNSNGSGGTGGGTNGGTGSGLFGVKAARGGQHASPEKRELANAKACKKAVEDMVMSLKERSDEIESCARLIVSARAEKDNLTTQVEILEQAVQTMRYMVKDILARIYEREEGSTTVTTPTSAGGEGLPEGEGAAAKPNLGRRGSASSLPPVGGALPSEAASSSTGTASSAAAAPRRVDPRALRSEGVVSTLSASHMIACRGIGPGVPRFLAYSGWVRRYDLGKRHTELIIKEIWSLKTIADETRRKSGLPRTTLQDFFQTYLSSRFPPRSSRAADRARALHAQMEFVYNFVSSCAQYRSDHDMDLFDQILFGHVSEDKYVDQMTMMAHFKKALTQMDCVDGTQDGFIHKMVFFAGLRQFFPVKSEENMRALIEIVLREMQSKATAAPTLLNNHAAMQPGSPGSGGAGVAGSIAVAAGSSSILAAGASGGSGGASGPAAGVVRGELAVDISKLMAETSDGDESVFMDAIRSQYEDEVNAFPLQIAAALTKASRAVVRQPMVAGLTGAHGRHHSISAPSVSSAQHASSSASLDATGFSNSNSSSNINNNGATGGWLPAGQIAAILQELDPNKTSLEIEALMRRGLGLDGYHLASAAAAQQQHPREAHAQVLREHKDGGSAAQQTAPSASSRSTTPSQHTRSVSVTVATVGGTSSPAKESPTSPITGRKLSANVSSGGLGGVAPISTRRDSFGTGAASGSTPTTPLASSGSQSSLLHIPHSTTRQHSRMSVGLGLSFANVASPLAGTPAPAQSGLPVAGAAAAVVAAAAGTSSGASVTPASASGSSASIRSASRESDRRTHSSGSMRAGPHLLHHHQHNPSHSLSHTRTHSRNMSRSSNPGAATAGTAGISAASGTGASVVGRPGGGSSSASYDPSQFVELSTFLERLNSLFLHRTGHYNANLDIPGLAQLIKDELERVADEERKARELAANKKGFAGPLVNALALPSWAALWSSYNRAQHMSHVRDEVLRALIRKYSRGRHNEEEGQEEERPGSRASQKTMRSHRSQVSLRSYHGRTGSTASSVVSGISGGGGGGRDDEDVASVVAAELDAPELVFSVNDSFNRVVTFYRGDATQLQVDAIVNAANPQLVAGGGICAAIFGAAGHAQLSRACAKLGGCAYGHTKVTSGFKLPAKFILHAVSPVDNSDAAALESCYTTILDACLSRGLRSVAMCCLATGICGFRNVDACEIALRTTRRWMDSHVDPVSGRQPFERVVFCVFTEEDASVYNTLLTIFFPCASSTGATGAAATTAASAGAHADRAAKKHIAFVATPPHVATAQESKEETGAPGSANAPPFPSSPKPVVQRKRSTRQSLGSAAAAASLGLTTQAFEPPPSVATATAQAIAANLSSVRRKQQQLAAASRTADSADGSMSARNLAAYKYVYPTNPAPPPPKTASELFGDSVVAPFVPPQPKPPALPRDGSRDYQLYQAHRSGAPQAASADSHASVALTSTGPTGRSSRSSRHHTHKSPARSPRSRVIFTSKHDSEED